MKITSPAFFNHGVIPGKYTCDGENISPPLQIFEVPPQAKSLSLICEDPDAPGGTFTHWLVWNINPTTTEVAEGNTPTSAVEGRNDFGRVGYAGPCPPSGIHRYFFKLFALDSLLDLAAGSAKRDLEKAIVNHILTKAELIGTYQRKG